MQIGPEMDPQIAIYHHAKRRGVPTVYLATLTDEAHKAWSALGRAEELVLQAGKDFTVQRGKPIGEVVSVMKDDRLDVVGQITVSPDHIVVALRITPSSGATQHPIDGRFPTTTRERIRISVHSPE